MGSSGGNLVGDQWEIMLGSMTMLSNVKQKMLRGFLKNLFKKCVGVGRRYLSKPVGVGIYLNLSSPPNKPFLHS